MALGGIAFALDLGGIASVDGGGWCLRRWWDSVRGGAKIASMETTG